MTASSAAFEQDPGKLAKEAALHQWRQKSGNGAADWPDPEPLVAPGEAELPYPVNALPPILHDAVIEYAQYGQQPIPIIATSALACTSLAAQGLANVARDDYLIGPISIYFMVIALSGERKTSADNWFKAGPRAWMITRRDAMQPEIDAGSARFAAWKAEREGLLRRIKAARSKKDNRDDRSLED